MNWNEIFDADYIPSDEDIRLQRVPFRKMYQKMQDDIQIDPERCTLCGYCVRICPSDNLQLDDDSITTRGNCVLCVRCYNFCPQSAIMHMGHRHNLWRGVPYRGPLPGFDPEMLR